MSKGVRTRAAILGEALSLMSTDGLSGLTIGLLAERTGLSKSGLFAHFGSKEQLQVAVLQEAQACFTTHVIRPVLDLPRGLPRLEAFAEGWWAWNRSPPFPGGCPIQAASLELDDRPGPLRDEIAGAQRRLRAFIRQGAAMAVAAGHFRPGLDCTLFAFQMVGIAFAQTMTCRLLGEPEGLDFVRRAWRLQVDGALGTTQNQTGEMNHVE
ncbi:MULTISPECIES: TetR/AcrR family transcriptional regulator [Nitrospirillum]|uniref:TetR family transcriptional regulator n=2 Tax=Nitrospirillum TaxID=1543705 RepID=A0A248JPY7_9PROT|nr:TetR/AcrR family transcriptional regulator [Nitrospirillum amazonense]ASG20138.1 TetR family transcriptional regulator [Nitrospirillum amazonense CBAmc]MEC4595190.1 TetR/AcrR family transcriptional regulator [Nitrospirillum amazonense]TWB15166.1 TetR family transcriptional regulator [Nitrospirillum amazonense]TWB36153.1 TetR family transcriptional regulator [Nitrospirillum amazonense]